MIGSVGRALRGAQAAFLLDGTLLEIDPDTFAADHEAHARAPATNATATMLAATQSPTSPRPARSHPQPERTPTRSQG